MKLPKEFERYAYEEESLEWDEKSDCYKVAYMGSGYVKSSNAELTGLMVGFLKTKTKRIEISDSAILISLPEYKVKDVRFHGLFPFRTLEQAVTAVCGEGE